ncbi:MAG: AMP-binding protein [Pseudomonadota bacterium]|nr:AMP-binding protein [Pseudomonadota bacterium]
MGKSENSSNQSTEKVWLKHYPKGVRADVKVDPNKTLPDLFEEIFAKYGDKSAFTNMGKTLTYAELDQLSKQFANYLLKTAKLKKGDRVAIMMPNLLQYPICIYGALRAGMTVVNVNPLYTAKELAHQLKDSGSKAIVVLANFAHTLQAANTGIENVIITEVGDMLPAPKRWIVNFVVKYIKKMVKSFSLPSSVSFRKALWSWDAGGFSRPTLKGDDIAFLQYTGGTTGVSKGAVLLHRNILANVEQAKEWISSSLTEGGELVVTPLPLYHIFSLTANCLIFGSIGGHNYLITNPRDIPNFIKEIKYLRFTVITGVNTLFNGLLNNHEFSNVDFSKLKVSLGGGMAVQKAVADKWQQVTNCALVEAYGLTETSPAVCINPLTIKEFNGSIGLPISSTDVSIRDESGAALEIGQEGELWVKGPQVMQGYWQRQDETDKVISAGWLKTGDIAVMQPDGYIKLVDRKKDMILVSGFNVYPNQIEEEVAKHPEVLEVAAIGVPDEKSGEAVKLFVVKRSASLTEQQVIEFCSKSLTRYKLPKYVEFRSELPKTNVGKILRRELRDTATAS